ncbi:Inositol hexakisphosphate kinase 1-like isoform X2 [Aphelenchoides besseyi]|nr:Inositol hexakisphosphate kinase 1-like isoform X2 [Aphelenchoides besseyi]KAI6194296.1 Inositol hexakisphosphate kinase 1-like isoform X2 [Aphelenchoides besseyi]
MRFVKKAVMVATRLLFPACESKKLETKEKFDASTALLQPFKHQVAGHIGFYSIDEDHICKPYNQSEADFYHQMPSDLRGTTPALCFEAELKPNLYSETYDLCITATNSDSSHEHEHKKLCLNRDAHNETTDTEFRDIFSGLMSDLNPWSLQCQMRRKSAQSLQKFMVFEDLTAKFHTPNILDFKLGIRQYTDSASEEKKHRQRLKCDKSTSKSLGIRLCGLQYFDDQLQNFQCVNKYSGRSLDVNGLRKFINHFFRSSSGNIRLDDCVCLLKQIENIKKKVESIPGLRLYGVSLLIILEGSPDASYDQPQPVARLIDFAHASLDANDSNVDEGCLLGLSNFSLILKDLITSSDV